jgi:hypothetical protein
MNPLDLLALIRSCDQQIASLFAEMITINFAMIVAIYYFLARAQLGLKLAAFVFYAVGMLAIFGMMLREANIKQLALTQIAQMTPSARGAIVEGYYELSRSWVFQDTAFFINGAHWLLWLSVIYLLFFWRRPA